MDAFGVGFLIGNGLCVVEHTIGLSDGCLWGAYTRAETQQNLKQFSSGQRKQKLHATASAFLNINNRQ